MASSLAPLRRARRRPDHSLPAGQAAGHKAAEGFKKGGPVPPDRAARHRDRVSGDLVSRRRARAGGTVDRDRQRHRSARTASRQQELPAAMQRSRPGSVAAISTLLGSPLVGASSEEIAAARARAGVVLVPGLLAAGLGSVIFVGLDPGPATATFVDGDSECPAFRQPGRRRSSSGPSTSASQQPYSSSAIRRLGLFLQPIVDGAARADAARGLASAGLAIAFAETTGKSTSEVLFSGQDRSPAHPERRRLVIVGARVADRLQGPRLRSVAQQLPRRPRVPRPRSSEPPAALRSPTYRACP